MSDTPFTLGASATPTIEFAPPLNVLLTPAAPPVSTGVWMPVDLPSMGTAGYPAQIRVRKFGIPDLARMGAANKSGSYPMVVATIGATLDGMNGNMLTPGDFDFLMHWHSVNSLPKTPIRVTYQSRYGFKNTVTVTASTRKTTYIEDVDKVRALQAKGYDFARVGDDIWRQHMIDLNKFTDELAIEFSLATWARVDDPTNFESKLAVIRSQTENLDFYEGLDEWRTVANHGIQDTATLTCQHFDPSTAIDRVTNSLAVLAAAVSNGDYDESVASQVQSLLIELASLRKLEELGQLDKAQPVEEVINIPLDATSFFPYLL